MHESKQKVTIKGTRDGLTLFIDDLCSFEEAFEELSEKIAASQPDKDEPIAGVTVKLGNRYLAEKEKQRLRELIANGNRMTVQAIESDVIRREDALKWREESEVKTISRIVRSGQVLKVNGDLLLIGDVNPGGHVCATGNVYILGNLYGIAHAGYDGDLKSVIIASYMKPNQLRIAGHIRQSPDDSGKGMLMGCGVYDETSSEVLMEKLQKVRARRHELDGFERRMLNG
ncbi:septum site-determining protein MinC [Aciduricibacillus chroicocephali]|uniref:Probable septum site-determining protein MinC n=1 Tax=Aciduricibacillus chroicocephali TaxID=3054939 RepID=A0ABY9KS83_9BACI|nr:septum site-determining protein MinC [Bacillaceae bacterium 44XB]